MSDTVIQQAEEIFYDTLRIPASPERGAFLDRACGRNTKLREAVEKMLQESGEVERFFEESRPQLGRDGTMVRWMADTTNLKDLEVVVDGLTGTKIGPYKLLEKIGEGGCGAVYMAEQEKPVRRRVAVKIIKLGMDTKNVIARFEAERQALAMMDHPNIARVLDAGATETGRPYFVMELVRGIKITNYCDENRLSVQQRLDLLIQICGAVQHAHQKGIVHRDLKPSNILITMLDGKPVPKVIDFGIAKATTGERLTDNTLFTPYQQFIGTPAYMSPEQAQLSGMDVDTRSDIYSLGVLLYELLTGKTPFEQSELLKAGIEEMRRTLREREPQRPSTRLDALQADELTRTTLHRQVESPKLKSLLRGDLDWIVMMALEKDRNRRYQTANGLALDLHRYLAHEPVLACPPSRWYRLQKLVRRNRGTFFAGLMVALALIAGLGLATFFWHQERQAHQKAVIAEREQMRLRLEAEDRERVAQAAYLISQGKLAEADSLVSKALVLKPTLETEKVLRDLGIAHALKGDWELAAARFKLLLQVDQHDNSWAITDDLLMAGPILIERGDLKGYEQFRQAAITQFAGTVDPIFAERTLKICLLLPAEEAVMKSLEPLGEAAANSLQGLPDYNENMVAWRCISVALMAYRQGYTPTAKAWCQRCLSNPDYNPARIATAHIIRAMACHKLGENEEALADLAEGRELITTSLSGGLITGTGGLGFWYDWLFARILMREAENLVK